jgi:N6-adenosine-specific RNA methylase IME4
MSEMTTTTPTKNQLAKLVDTVPAALKALAAMERQLLSAKTYDEIRRVIKEATALKVLMDGVAEVKAAAEDAILLGNKRIAEELRKVPKASGGDRKSNFPREGNLKSGRAATGIKHSKRSRIGKLADLSAADLKATANNLRAEGKDATVTAVVRAITQGDKKERRAQRERELAQKVLALPEKKFAVVAEDFEWDHKTWSEAGKDRHASNHYPTSTDAHTAKEIVERTKDRFVCAADDCVLFMWTTAPHLAIAIDVMRLRGFDYKSNTIWGKDKFGTGYWFRNKHEQLLIGVRGNIPCPAEGDQWDSLIMAPRGEHSEKPECFLEMIAQYFPNLPKIELNRRGPPRPGWEAWGNEIPPLSMAAE